jgi:(2Fe-2S) ferredoxin
MADAPQMSPYRRHLLLCTGHYCDPTGQAKRLYALLPSLLGDLAAYDNPERVKRGITACLGVCTGGPLLVVYPDGVWYHHVNEGLLAQIVEEHLRDERPVQAAIFHQCSDSSDTR